MRLFAIGIVLLAAAPAFAQTPNASDKNAPPPEGFYRDVPNAYDLLLRPQVDPNITLTKGRSLEPDCPPASTLTDREKAIRDKHLANGNLSLERSPGGRYTSCKVVDAPLARGN